MIFKVATHLGFWSDTHGGQDQANIGDCWQQDSYCGKEFGYCDAKKSYIGKLLYLEFNIPHTWHSLV